MTDDELVTTRDAAQMFGYRPDQHRAARLYFLRKGLEPWRDGGMIRWWRSDLLRLRREGGTRREVAREQPASPPTPASRFRKPAA